MSKDSGGFGRDKINHKVLEYKLVNSYLCVLNENNLVSSFFEFVLCKL